MKRGKARVSVYVPNFNGQARLLEALRGFAAQTHPVASVVVDNGSTDGSVTAVKREFPDACLVELWSNRGFGPALNEAVTRFPAEVLIFANNDVRPEPRFVEALLDEQGTSPASAAGVLLQCEYPNLIDSAGVVVDSTLLAFDYLHGLSCSVAEAAPPPLGPTGGAALVPHSAFAAVGGFDERIFAYLEDVDLALRMSAIGLPCRLAPAARAIHQHSATLGSGSAAKNRLMGWSRGYMLRRYGVLRSPRRALRAITAEAVICAGQAVVDGNVSGIAGRVSGWRAASGLPVRRIPPGAAVELGLDDALRRRAARRLPIHSHERASSLR